MKINEDVLKYSIVMLNVGTVCLDQVCTYLFFLLFEGSGAQMALCNDFGFCALAPLQGLFLIDRFKSKAGSSGSEWRCGSVIDHAARALEWRRRAIA